jgi:hypothetical protein
MSYTGQSTYQGGGALFHWQQFYYDAWRTWGVYYAAAYRDLRAYAGDNWTNLEKQKLLKQNRMVLELNKIRRVVNLYSGYERENRMATVCAPVEDADVETADLFSDVMYQVYEKGDADYVFSEAFEHMLKTGLAIIGIYMDYSKDKVCGDIKFFWRPFNALMLDPYFTRRDLGDNDQASTRQLLSREQVKALLPFIDPEEIDNIPTGIRDNKYQYLGIYRQYNSTYIAKNLLTYDEYWIRKNVPQKYLVDEETGITTEWEGTREEEKYLKLSLEETPNMKLIHSHKLTVEYNVIVGGRVLYSGKDSTSLDTYPFALMLGYFEPLIDTYELKIQGIVRSIVDAQRQYNRRHSQIIDLMESVINTGWISKNGAVLDPQMLMQAGAGRQVVVNEGYDISDLREILPPQIPPGYLQYQDIMDKNIMEIPGASEELLGLSSVGDSQVSGRLAEVRTSNGLKGNRGLFDNYEFTKKQVGRLVLEAIQKNYTPGKIYRMTGRQPTPQFFDGEFEEYDCAIKQAVKTPTQREAYYYQLLQLLELGAPIPWDAVLEAAPIQGKTKLVQILAQQQQAQEEAQEQEKEDAIISRRLALSQTEQNLALSEERRARVLSDIGLAKERISEGEQNYAKALLDNAKTAKEIQDLDRKTFLDILEVSKDLQIAHESRIEKQLERDMQKAQKLKSE